MRKALTISTTSSFYQFFTFGSIILSFTTSFSYAYYAAFMQQMSEEEKAFFRKFDRFCTLFFCIDFIIHIFVDEHNPRLEGHWTLKKSCLKQLKGRLLLDIVAIINFRNLFGLVFDIFDVEVAPEILNLLYAIKLVRLT